MPFNNWKLNSVRIYGKEVNLSAIGATLQNSYRYPAHAIHDPASSYQNLRYRFGIEHHAYTRAAYQIPCVCMYVCMYVCLTTPPEPLNRFA